MRGSVTVGSLIALAVGGSSSAQVTIVRESIAYEGARTIVERCVAMADSLKSPVAIWVLDITGQPVYFVAKNARELMITGARLKAETSLKTGAPSEGRVDFLATPKGARIATAFNLFTNDGGLPIIKDGKVIGAVGVGGFKPDANGKTPEAACAQAGIDAALK